MSCTTALRHGEAGDLVTTGMIGRSSGTGCPPNLALVVPRPGVEADREGLGVETEASEDAGADPEDAEAGSTIVIAKGRPMHMSRMDHRGRP